MICGAATGATLSRVLDAAEDAPPGQAVESVTRELSDALGATAVSFLITDLSGRALVRLPREHAENETPDKGGERQATAESTASLTFGEGPAERALRTQTVQALSPETGKANGFAGEGWTVLAPVTERGEVLGLLEMSLPTEPDPAVLAEIARTAHVLGFVVIANRRHTDLFEWGQRSTQFSLAAEIQRRLLPTAMTCEGGAFTLSAWLEPADDIAGDTFDYSVGGDDLHLSMTDAMGHGVASALTATLCLGSLRNSRRGGASLIEQATAANVALVDHVTSTADEGFVTGILGRLDLGAGELALVNAGHVLPYLARAGRVAPVNIPPALPLGLFPDTDYSSTEMILQAGDRLVFLTDGMLERSAAGLDLVAEIHETRSLHPRETTRRLADKVLDVTGSSLADDATLMVLDWHAEHGRQRDTTAGADTAQPNSASQPN